MASNDQFNSFKAFYDLEEARRASLSETAKNYFTFATLILGYLGFKTADNAFANVMAYSTVFSGLPFSGRYAFAALILLLLASLLLILIALFLRGYMGAIDEEAFFQLSADEAWSDARFFDELIICYNVATAYNRSVNDARARYLEASSVAIFAAIVVYAGIYLLMLSLN
jgi:hypothetical protein